MDFLHDLIILFHDEVGTVSLILSMLAGISVVVASGLQLYTKIRPRFPVRVNCWFCNKNAEVSFVQRNSWECQHCEQYNGFLQDGDYNKLIPGQSDELLNHFVNSVKRIPYKASENGLCRKCNINQELKVQQLASFIPIDNSNFDEEIELYRQRLERAYQLCEQCNNKVNMKLQSIGARLKKMYSSQTKRMESRLYENEAVWRVKLVQAMHGIFCITAMAMSLGPSACVCGAQALHATDVVAESTERVLAALSQWEFEMAVGIAVLLLCCVATGPHWLSLRLLPATLWGLAALVRWESTRLAHLLDQASLDTLKLAIMSTVLLTTLLTHMSYFKRLCGISKPQRVIPTGNPAPSPPVVPVLPAEESACKQSNSVKPAEDTYKATPTEHKSPENLFDPAGLQSELGGLSLGPMLSSKPSTPSLFEPRVYQSPSNHMSVASSTSPYSPVADNSSDVWEPRLRKPILSPARLQLNNLTHSSWVAGGYWQNHMFPHSPLPPSSFYGSLNSLPKSSNYPLSRSSSQSSGFASQGGTNYSSLPSSRAGSVFEADRISVLSEPIYPSYSPPIFPPYCYYVTPHPATFFCTPPPSQASPTPSVSPVPCTPQETISEPPTQPVRAACPTSKSVLSLVRENFFLATLFFSSLVFNAVVIGLAALNTYKLL